MSQNERKIFLNTIKIRKVEILKYLQPTASLFFALVHGELSNNSTLLKLYDFLDATALFNIRKRYTVHDLVCLKIENATYINLEKTFYTEIMGLDYYIFPSIDIFPETPINATD